MPLENVTLFSNISLSNTASSFSFNLQTKSARAIPSTVGILKQKSAQFDKLVGIGPYFVLFNIIVKDWQQNSLASFILESKSAHTANRLLGRYKFSRATEIRDLYVYSVSSSIVAESQFFSNGFATKYSKSNVIGLGFTMAHAEPTTGFYINPTEPYPYYIRVNIKDVDIWDCTLVFYDLASSWQCFIKRCRSQEELDFYLSRNYPQLHVEIIDIAGVLES